MLKRLNGSWYLTDGILTPVRLDAPACVGDALRGAGILTDGESAADLLKNEWIYRREWRYSLSPEGGFPADGRAYLSLFGLRGEWTALLDGCELARGDDTEAEIALPAGEPGATLTIAFAVPAAAPLWPRVGLDGGCLLRTVGSAAITSLSLNVPDDAPWTARTAVRAEAAGACDLRYVLEIGGERTETIVRETLAPGENFFEHTIHEPARPAACAPSAASPERAATCSSGATSPERAAAFASGAASPERAATFAPDAASPERAATFASGAAPSERAAASASGAALSERAAASSSGAASPERAGTPASSVAAANSSVRTMSETKTSTGRGFFARILHKNERSAATANPSARSTPENDRAAVLASGANFLERFSTGADSAARAASPVPGAASSGRFSTDADSPARGAANSDSAARTTTENRYAATFAPGADSSTSGAMNSDSAARAATPASGENFLERFSADADSAARAANPTSNENFLERFSADADSAARVNGVDSAAYPANRTSNENFLEHFSADADFSDYAAADNGRAAADTGFSARTATENGRAAAFASGAASSERTAADTGFSARAATDNGRAAAFASGAASSERTAANAGFSARAATDNGRAAAFVNGATFSERAAVLANGADSATRAAVTVSLRAEILSGGVVSDSRDARLYIPADEAAPRGFAGADAVSAALAAEIGANALCAPDASRARMAAAEHELAFIPYHSLATQRAARACQRYEALLRLAGDESRVLDPALWRLTGCDMDAPELSSLLSSDGDFEEVCRRSRYRQAIALRDAAEHARMKRVPFLLDGAKDDAPTCLSGALFDLDGAARPAYFALADAWKSEHAFVLPPESFPADGIVSVPVFYLSDEKTPPCTVNVRAYSMDGQELITAGFPVPGRATDVIGRLCVEMPEDGLLLLRASVLRDGACVSRSDRLITLNEACLSALRPVQLLPDAATLRNASNTVAVGVSVPAAHYFGALLPGETLPLGEPRLTGFEALNPLLGRTPDDSTERRIVHPRGAKLSRTRRVFPRRNAAAGQAPAGSARSFPRQNHSAGRTPAKSAHGFPASFFLWANRA